MPASTGTRALMILAAAGVVLMASACGAGSGPTQTVTVTASPGPTSATEPETRTYTSSPLPVSSSPGIDPKGLHPLAGGPIPDAAFELEVLHDQDGAPRSALQTPSGNIYCEFGRLAHGCGVKSYKAEEQYGSTEQGPRWWFDLSEGTRPAIDAAGEPASDLYREHPPQVLEYGQAAYIGDDVCAAEEDGLACWNARTGHGVFMSRGGYQTF
ncbi:MAG: hypothetical protein QJR09_02565 [Micrococcus sp.]|nr:hypothetical protein [Micrococcus sp.]